MAPEGHVTFYTPPPYRKPPLDTSGKVRDHIYRHILKLHHSTARQRRAVQRSRIQAARREAKRPKSRGFLADIIDRIKKGIP